MHEVQNKLSPLIRMQTIQMILNVRLLLSDFVRQSSRHILLMVRQPIQMFLPPCVEELQEVHHHRPGHPHHNAVPRPAVLHSARSHLSEDRQRTLTPAPQCLITAAAFCL